ncbi:MAG: amino acid racemase, partial [Oscillospiraceae bacterium]
DRTQYILDNTKPNPVNMMKEDAQKLQAMGADIVVTPCNTAHFFFNELSNSIQIPFINMIEETANLLSKQKVKKVGILATNGTIKTELFQNVLIKKGIIPICPSAENQQFVMDIIYDNVKANKPIDLEKFKTIVGEMRLNECEKIILGCTELSVIKREYSLNDYYVDSLEVLAECAIIACGKAIKKEPSNNLNI